MFKGNKVPKALAEMENIMNTKAFSYSKWLTGAVCCIIIAAFFLLGSLTFFKNAHDVDTNISFNGEAYLSFNNNYAAVGTPLTVNLNGASDENAVYEWFVGGSQINNPSPTYTPSANDLEKFITVTVTYDKTHSVSASLYCSKLPVIYINTDEAIGDEYVGGTMAMQGNSSYTMENTDFYFGDVYLKLRGNSTRYREKAPYKIKLSEECNLFNMGSGKHWVLLANDIDHTLIRNKLVYDFSADISADYAAESLNVVLILNNEYRGVYQLCEQIRVDEERVDIFDWEALAKEAADTITRIRVQTYGLSDEDADIFQSKLEYALCTDFSWISYPYTFEYEGYSYTMTDYVDIPDTTGGFLLEMDFYNLENENGITTNYKQPFYFNTPEYGYTNSALKLYAYKYIQSFEYALHSPDFTFSNNGDHNMGQGLYYDPAEGWTSVEQSVFYTDYENDGKHYSQMFDMNSLITNFFVCEFTMNWDSMKNSVFVTKDIDGLAKLNPVWDFDWAFGNDNMHRIFTNYPTGWHTTNNYFTKEQYYQSVQWNRYLIRDPYFLMLAYNKYKEIRPGVIEDIIKDGGLLDTYYEELYEAGIANDARWSQTYNAYGGKNYEESMAALRKFIETRVDWLDKQFATFETFVESTGYYIPSDLIEIKSITYNNDNTVTMEGYTTNREASDMAFQINGTTIITGYSGTDGLCRITFDASVLNDAGNNIVQIHCLDKYGNYIEDCTNYKIF